MKNRFGVDTSYFQDKLGILIRDIDNYTPDQLARALSRLACVSDAPVAYSTANKELQERLEASTESDTWELENQVLELKSALASVFQDLRDRASMSRGERVLPLSSGTYLKAMEALGDNT